MKENGDMICFDPMVEKDSNHHEDLNKEFSPRVCCFSGKNNNILMWSHYANNHQGIASFSIKKGMGKSRVRKVLFRI
jgi:hypothetical protein